MSSGNKYHRTIISLDRKSSCVIDVYDVIAAFDVKCPARQHALKKILCAGIRGKGNEEQDLSETIDAVRRAIDLCKPVENPFVVNLTCSKIVANVIEPLDLRPYVFPKEGFETANDIRKQIGEEHD